MRFLWIVAVILGTSAGFGGGYLTATQLSQTARQDAVRQELLKQLVATKAGIETGLSLTDLRGEEKHVKAAFDLASDRLDDRQKQYIAEALDAISLTHAAWQETLTTCHSGNYEGVSLLVISDCDNKTFERIFDAMGILPKFTKMAKDYSLFSTLKTNTFLGPLLQVSLSRIQTAIDSLR
jgi:hypothetical protein